MSISDNVRDYATERPQPAWIWPAIFLTLLAAPLIGLSLIPGTLEDKSLAVLHGLCAQQPAHSIYFGDQRLPFDARMTGIYGGAAVTAIYLLALGRWRAGGVPSARLMLLIGIGVVGLAFDGVNSTLDDVGLWSLYEPLNSVRLATGLLTGLALTSFIWLIFGQLGFRLDERMRQPVWAGLSELAGVYGALAAFGLLVSVRVEFLRIPLTYLLIVSVILVLTSLLSVFVLLLRRAENQARSIAELAPHLTIGLLAAFLLMAALAGGRFALEAWAGIQTAS